MTLPPDSFPSARGAPNFPMPAATAYLLPKNFLHLPDFLLYLAGDLFRFTFVLEVGIVCQLSNFFFHFSLQVVQLALDFILYSWLHRLSSSRMYYHSSVAITDCLPNPWS